MSTSPSTRRSSTACSATASSSGSSSRTRAAGATSTGSRPHHPRTRLIFVSHVTCTTGQRFPDKDIAALARSKGIWFALDGAQAPVCVPFDIGEIGVDFYTCSTHKWLMGPKRTGFIYVRKEMLDVLRPLTVGAGSNKSYDAAKGSSSSSRRSSASSPAPRTTPSSSPWARRSISSRRSGPTASEHHQALAERFYAGLEEIPGVERVSPEEEAYRTSMIGFRMKTDAYTKINEHLAKDKIRVRTVTEGGLNSIRVSFHICNHDGEVTKILDSLKKLAG